MSKSLSQVCVIFKQTETILVAETTLGFMPVTAIVDTAPVVVLESGIAIGVALVKVTGPVAPPTPSYSVLLNCGDHDHSHGLLTIEQD